MNQFIKKNQSALIRIGIFFIALVSIFLYIKIRFINSIINLIIISFVIAFILTPIKSFFEKKFNMNSSFSSVIVIVILALIFSIIFFVFIPIMIREISLCDFSFDEIFNYIKRLENSFIKNNSMINAVYIEFKEKGTVIISKMSEGAITKLLDLTKDLISFAEIPIITYYILKEKKRVNSIVKKFIPLKRRRVFSKISLDCSRVLRGYIIGQLLLSLIISVLTFIILLAFNVKLPLCLSIINGVFNIIPYFGPIIGAVPIVIIALSDSLIKGVWVLVFMIIIQQVEGDIILPKITGHITNIHPGIIILLLIAGEKLGGLFGMVLAVPLGVIIKVIYKDVNHYIFDCSE